MEKTLLKSGANFVDIINAANVNKKFTLELNGDQFTLLRYYKAQPKEADERPFKGNQTQITVKWSSTKEIEHYITSNFREKFCPEYTKKAHAHKTKKFEVKNLEFASEEELKNLIEKCSNIIKERENTAKKSAIMERFSSLSIEEQLRILGGL